MIEEDRTHSIALGRLIESVKNLQIEVVSLRLAMDEVKAAINRGRGAIWGIGLTSGITGAFIMYVIRKVWG